MVEDRNSYIPIPEDEFYFIQNHYNARFDYVLHYHSGYELNLVFNTSGKRIINDCVEEFSDIDLVLAGPLALHSWKDYTKKFEESNARVVTLQFHNDFLDHQTIQRKPLTTVREMLQESSRGILFSKEAAVKVKNRLINLYSLKGFYAFIEFLSLLYELSISPGKRLLSSSAYAHGRISRSKDRLSKVIECIHQNFSQNICMEEVASVANLSVSAFSHYFKKHTTLSYIDYVIEYRVSRALYMLAFDDDTVSEIAYRCGFSNISNFNRLFKRKVGCTPLEYRKKGRNL